MPAIPLKRLLVYVVLGLVVLAAGTVGVVCMRGSSPASVQAMTIRTGDDAASVEAATAVGVAAGGAVDGAATGTAATGSGGGAGQAGGAGAASTTTQPPLYVQVAGAVRRPGVYQLPAGARMFQAIEKAGGFALDADQQAVTLAAKLTDGCRVYVPKLGETSTIAAAGAISQTTDGTPNAAAPLSLNSATLEELDALPGVGPATAQAIITYRETNGPFTSVDELGEVPGIGPAKLERIRPLVAV